jgi:hypothetical protein
MIKIALKFLALLMALLASFSYGVVAHKHKLFPFPQLKYLHDQQVDGPWTIGIYEGTDPLALKPAANVRNPVLTAEDVLDVNAQYVADPFLYRRGESWYMFFEVKNRRTNQGDIGYATSSDGLAWTYGRLVLDEPHHLSYPHVFDWEGSTYMIPESGEAATVSLYRASAFPTTWERVGDLLDGFAYTDPTVFRHGGRWWMFVSSPGNDILKLYHSDKLEQGWTAHPRSPLIVDNPNIARPAGRVVEREGRLYRVAQDDYPLYGLNVLVFEITNLTPTEYAEKPVSDEPLLGPSGSGWNGVGMHHADIVRDGSRWIAAVDGRSR